MIEWLLFTFTFRFSKSHKISCLIVKKIEAAKILLFLHFLLLLKTFYRKIPHYIFYIFSLNTQQSIIKKACDQIITRFCLFPTISFNLHNCRKDTFDSVPLLHLASGINDVVGDGFDKKTGDCVHWAEKRDGSGVKREGKYRKKRNQHIHSDNHYLFRFFTIFAALFKLQPAYD